MFNTPPPKQRTVAMPNIATWLLSRLANPAYRDELIGDMEEEYTERQQSNQNTHNWLIRQTVMAIWDGQKAMIKSTNFLKVLSIILCVLTLPTIALFVGWLSNIKDPTEQLGQLLLSGKIHSILMHSDYWKYAWNESGVAHLELAMFINIPAILWAMVFAGASYMLLKKVTPSVWIFSAIALAFTFLPYLFGYAVINSFALAAPQVGPILAFMILTPLFTIPVYIGFLFKWFPK